MAKRVLNQWRGYTFHVLQERMAEFGDGNGLSGFEQGRWLMCWEIMDVVQTRHSAMLELIEDEE